MRLVAGIIIVAAFVVWALYRLLIKKDLRQNTTALYTYGGFALAWTLIYLWLIN
ncbi:MAG: hypothetical protein M0D57_09870 [Sphingobacteriales bacterium JAD_PAG50586_3]|nr:MAG: hypothetical protein M0D57_09870 [Sphingobacteriales bacterium JAD_PAG50586_3]